MYTFKIVTTVLNVIMMGIIFFILRDISWEREKETVIGFSAIQILYIMNLFCMWSQKW